MDGNIVLAILSNPLDVNSVKAILEIPGKLYGLDSNSVLRILSKLWQTMKARWQYCPGHIKQSLAIPGDWMVTVFFLPKSGANPAENSCVSSNSLSRVQFAVSSVSACWSGHVRELQGKFLGRYRSNNPEEPRTSNVELTPSVSDTFH